MSCKECIYWDNTHPVKSFGCCTAPVPNWVLKNGEEIIFHLAGEGCECFTEEQQDLEDALNNCKTQLALYKGVINT
jgi:hypothetical protein